MSSTNERPGFEITIVNAHPRYRLRHAPFRDAIERLLRWKRRSNGVITVIFVDSATLLQMNRDFLSHDYHTDVITFPLEERPLEGEIYIDLDTAAAQAKEYGAPFYEETRRLVIHGTLHLLGYDDATSAQRAAMTRLEERFLSLDRTS
jgi:rRNA maturation RNase YbeY